ncbi:MAG: LysR family transcriptional regulator [Rhodospirillales bacterium]|nr:LysR family transcriptional regulator [Rhodospirillales bacterium]MDH3918388.1 LysR family transcriptional regulator [Rhodospirillales bacterium]MDH3967980.1 LysR family transcriptional regulator [Rhodospirillales bacterium]
MPRPRLRVLLGSATAMGPGKADLLEAIDSEGSITGAARRMGMSYRRAWLLVEAMNACFRRPLVETARGGRRGGGARLTVLGREALARYRTMEAKAVASLEPDMAAFSELLSSRATKRLR